MKFHAIFALSVSLTVFACQATQPFDLIDVPKQTSTQFTLPGEQTKNLNSTTVATVTQSEERENIQIQLHLPENFKTRLADRSQLAYVKVTLKGQGLKATFTQDGQAFLPVIGNEINATVSGVPIDDNQLRVVTLQGYDANYNPLGSFEARGYYRSQKGVKSITITINRAQILLGRIIESTLANPSLLNALDLTALQNILEEAMGYLSGRFELDPSEFDLDQILTLIPSTGSPLPTAATIRAQARIHHEDVAFSLVTPNGAKTNENVRLVLNDPNSAAKILPRLSNSGTGMVFLDIIAGNWTLSAYSEAGNLLAQTEVSINDIGTSVAENPLMLTGVKEVEDFQVNTFTSGGQLVPDVAMDQAGNFIVVWESDIQDGSGNGIFAQRYRADGEVIGSEFMVNTYTFNNQYQPRVAIDADGDFVVSWTSNSAADLDIYARRFDSTGTAIGSEFRVNTGAGNSQENQAIAIDLDGDFAIVWDSYTEDGSSGGIFAQRYNSNGVAQGSQFRVNTRTTGSQSLPDIAMDDAGNFIVTWMSFGQDGDSWGIYAQRYNSAGVVQGSEFNVNSTTSEGQYIPRIATDADGDFVITWKGLSGSGYFDIFAQRFNSQGSAQGSEFQVNTYTLYHDNPDIAMDNTGNFVVSWESSGHDSDPESINAQIFDNSGNRLNSEFRVNSYTSNGQYRPAVSMNDGGDFVVTWHSWEQDGSGLGVFGQRYEGSVFNPP